MLLQVPLIRKQCRSQGPVILGQGGGVDGVSQFLLQRLDHAGVLGHAAGHNHQLPHTHAVGQAGHTGGHGVVDAVDDVALVSVHRQLADDLAFGKHGTGGADGHILGGLGRQISQLLHLDLQHPGHHVQEPAGTGRFLDVMARVLEVKVEELGDLAAKSTKDVAISSTCTVFAESEVISQLAMDTDKCDIINGIHHSVAARVAGLAHRVGVRELVVMTGGVAQNSGVVKALEEELGHTIHTSPLTQYNGALGAALFAYQRYLKEQKD